MTLSENAREFLAAQHAAAMITLGPGDVPKVARVGVAHVDGRLWSSGTRGRVRTQRLRRDPRCTLYVHASTWDWLALETRVTIRDGDDAPALNLRCSVPCRPAQTGLCCGTGRSSTKPRS